MSSFQDFERSQIMAIREREARDLDCIRCKDCGSQWFEQIEIERFQNQRQVVVGQPVPAKPGSVPYILLRCINCKLLVEPRVVHTTRDLAGADYDHFLDTIQGKLDTRKLEETKAPEPDPTVVPSTEV